MSEALSGMLPLAAAIAISPIPILGVILMLLSDRSTHNALAVLCGWALAIAVVSGVVALIGAGSADAGDEPARGLVYAQLGLAVLLLLGALRRWRKWARADESQERPKWLEGLNSIGPRRAFALGIAGIVLNPKDALLSVAAGARLAEADPSGGAGVIALLIFVAVCSSTIAAPIVATVASGPRAKPVLERWRTALERHGQLAVAIVLLILGIAVGIDGLREL